MKHNPIAWHSPITWLNTIQLRCHAIKMQFSRDQIALSHNPIALSHNPIAWQHNPLISTGNLRICSQANKHILYPLQQYFPPEITEKIKSLQESVEELSDDFSLFDTNGIRKFTIANNFINNNFVQKKKRKKKRKQVQAEIFSSYTGLNSTHLRRRKERANSWEILLL